DFEAVSVKLLDLLPGHVVFLVARKIKALRDEEGCAEFVLLEQWPGDGEVRFARIVERQDDQLIGNRFQSTNEIGRKQRHDENRTRSHRPASLAGDAFTVFIRGATAF